MTLAELPTLRVTENLLLPALQPGVYTPAATSGLALMTDFLATAAVSVAASASLGEAESRMRACGVGLLIVLVESSCVMGVIDRHDLHGARSSEPYARPGRVPGELQVVDRMVPLRDLEVLSLETLALATQAQVAQALQRSGRDHLLVIEPSAADISGRLRGVVARASTEPQAQAAAPARSKISA